MAKVYRSLGGAGTGKTSFILDSLTTAKREMRLGTHEIGFATFTRAGRQEIASRAAEAWSVDPEALTKAGWFRTAHSIAFRQCRVSEGQLIQGSDGDEWTGRAVGGTVSTRSDSRGERRFLTGEGGDPSIALSLKAWELARSKMTSVDAIVDFWTRCGEQTPSLADARRIIGMYETAKARDGRLDYTDMIARFAGIRFTINGPVEATPEGDTPEGLRVLAIDEAQDSSTLVDRVCRRLAASPSIERIWLCGDPYQSIHSFAGGDYNHFLSWDAEESIMPRSYRCPSQVLSLGESCLRQMTRGYRDRKIQPAGHEGSVRRAGGVEEAVSRLRADSSALILGRCAYSLEEYESSLIQRGVPYSWVDQTGSSASLSGYAALWGLQHGRVVSGDDWACAVQMIAVKREEFGPLLARGEKAAWKDGRRSHIDMVRPVERDLEQAGATPALQSLIREGRWYLAMEPKSIDKAKSWVDTAIAHGESVASNPKIRLSTIHSAKGLEADTVILSSITSPSVERGRMNMAELHDEECRVSYVAVTRAKKDFILVDDGSRYKLELPI